MSKVNSASLRIKRKARTRKRIHGTQQRPRLSVFRSDRHIYAQVIDDTAGKTLVSVHTFKKGGDERANVGRCSEIGKELATKCKEKNINQVVFDKNGYAYHGRIQALADGARENGLQF